MEKLLFLFCFFFLILRPKQWQRLLQLFMCSRSIFWKKNWTNTIWRSAFTRLLELYIQFFHQTFESNNLIWYVCICVCKFVWIYSVHVCLLCIREYRSANHSTESSGLKLRLIFLLSRSPWSCIFERSATSANHSTESSGLEFWLLFLLSWTPSGWVLWLADRAARWPSTVYIVLLFNRQASEHSYVCLFFKYQSLRFDSTHASVVCTVLMEIIKCYISLLIILIGFTD